MKKFTMAVAFFLGLFSSNVLADLEVYKDYDLAESVAIMTTVKVDANMMDVYLEGLKETWVKGSEVAKDLGHIQGYKILRSELPLSGQFNLVLMTYFKNGSDLEPSKKKYKEFMKAWGRANEKKTKKIVKTYPDVRELTGEYLLREIMMK